MGEAEEVKPSAFSISQQIIDEILTSGGNEPDSILRIVAYFKKDHTAAENADFLRREYQTDGKGFMFGGNRVSVWFDENGIRAAVGDTALIRDAALITWEQAAKRMRDMLDLGRFVPQNELDKVDGYEIKALAEQLWYLERDLQDGTEFAFMDAELFKGGFPDSTARIAEILAQPEQRRVILNGLQMFAGDYALDNNILRFRRSAEHLVASLNGLSDLEREPLTFTADESASSARPSFITQDEIDEVLIGGSGVEHGHYRIFSYFLHDHTAKEKADFLKHEYGTGGHGRMGFNENHDSKGIAYSRENNHMPYDKVILPWPKVAKRIDELIAAGRYMSQSQINHLPEYEKGIISSAIYNFFYNQPESVARPYPYAMYVTNAVNIIRPQLDQPERVAEILSEMQAILDNTADFDRNYQSMRQAFDNLTAYQNGTFTLFPSRVETSAAPVSKPTGQIRARRSVPAQPATPTPSDRAADETVYYDLQLGATVYLGIEEYEIYSFDDTLVVLRDVNAPLFTREMPRAEFDRKLRENRLNDGLIKETAPEPEVPQTESPRVLYKMYLPKLVNEILQDELYSFLQDSETEAYEAEIEIGNWLDYAADSEDYPGLREALELPDFRVWLREDILDRTYQDIAADKDDSVSRYEADGNIPEWAKRPQYKEQIRETLSLRGFTVTDAMIDEGIEDYRLLYIVGSPLEVSDYIEKEYLTKEAAPEPPTLAISASPEPEPYTPKFGDRYNIQGRIYFVDRVDLDYETVNLRDFTFESSTDFPIFRSESLDFIRMYEPIRESEPQITYKIGDRFTQIGNQYEIDSIGDFVRARRIDLNDPTGGRIQDFANFTKDGFEGQIKNGGIVFGAPPEQIENSLTPAWEKSKPRSRTQTFDAFPGVPMSERHNFVITNDDLGAGGAKTKYHYNAEAIRTLQQIESENRLATPEEQEILSRYVGWGGLADAFDESKPTWANEYAELKSLLSPEEYTSARATTLNAHYTPPIIVKAIWQALENMGFKTGNIVDPGCGIGNFQGLIPESMKDSKIFGVELDGVTGRIAQQLYQKNSIAIQGYEKTNLPDSFFDAAIGNVPFGDYGVSDKRYDKNKFSVHDYFFAKTLDKVRPGGIIAFVTTRFTMDKKNPAVRKYIAQRADLLGAIRLPNNAFLKNAGTDVTADIIFLQKRDRIIDIEPEWVHLGHTEDGITVNSYFIDNPGMVLGELAIESTQYGHDATCKPFEGADLAELLNEAVANIHAEITEYERDEDEPEEVNAIPADPTIRNFSYTLVDGKIYYRENSLMFPQELPITTQSRVRGMVELRECVRTLIEYQTEDYPESDIHAEQTKLNRLYDTFTRKYGLINDRANRLAFSEDESYPLLCSLEVLDENLKLKAKADMFTKRTIKPYAPITHVDTAVDALAVSIGERARVDLDFMSQLSGKDEETLKKELEGVIFLNVGSAQSQAQTYVTADEYLSGNVREKLEQARAAAAVLPALEANVRALESVQPKDLTAPEISVRLGATWLPTDVIQQFIHELLDTPWRVKDKVSALYVPSTAEWNVTNKSADRDNYKAYNTYGTKRMNAYHIIEQSLNLRTVRIFDTVYEDGKEKQVLNKKETAIAQDKQDIIKAKFSEWIWKDPDRRERLCAIYNERFNSIRPREYDGQHIRFTGMNPEYELEPHQRSAVARYLYGGNALFGHVVGAGKSFEMIASAMEAKRLGLCSKAMFAVPNNIIGDFTADFFRLYPSANVLMATAKDFEKKNRRKFCARISTGDYDGIIIAHSQFEKVPMSFGRQVLSLERQIRDISLGIAEVKEQNGERFTVKQLEKTRKSLELKLERLNDQSRKDSLVTFEELGVDALFVDEADLFKNLYLITKMRNVGGISQTESQKASDLFMKTQYLDELTGNRGVVFATGTPISNSMAEMYTMQRYLQYDTLVKHGLQHFDCWASTFGETTTAMELTPEGTGFQLKTRFSSFYNLPELMAMFKEVADIRTKDMLNLPTPKVNFHTVVTKPSEIQEEMIAGLADRAEKIRKREVDATEDNMLLITNDGRKIALDQRLANPLLPDFDGSKVNACAGNVFRIWEETRGKRLTQLVFCDLSTPKGKETPIEMTEVDGTFVMDENQFFNVYSDIRRKLIAKGVPAEEIAFIHEAKNEVQRKEIFAKVRAGAIRVLLGSTSKMGAGTNVQDLLIASHDLDCPWRPRDLEQRGGRIERRGNNNPEVDIYRYVTEGTFDAYCYQIIENKQRGISQVFTSKSPARVMQEIDAMALNYAEIKALATGNPMIIERCSLEAEVNKLIMLKSNHLSQRYELEDKIIKVYPVEIAQAGERIQGYTADIATVTANTPADKDTFPPMEIGGIFYSEKKDAGAAIIAACKAMTSPDPVPLGEYRGFQMELSFNTFAKEYHVALKSALSYTVTLGSDIHGNITRIDNALEGIESKKQGCEEQLEKVRALLETAKVEVQAPFQREMELEEKNARLSELTIALKLKEKDNEILDEAPDEGDMKPAPRDKGRGR